MGGPWMLGLEPKPQCVTQAAIHHLVDFQWPKGSGLSNSALAIRCPKHCGLTEPENSSSVCIDVGIPGLWLG